MCCLRFVETRRTICVVDVFLALPPQGIVWNVRLCSYPCRLRDRQGESRSVSSRTLSVARLQRCYLEGSRRLFIVTARMPSGETAMILPTARSRVSAFENLKPKAYDIRDIDRCSIGVFCTNGN